jgi:O-methyltransferase
MPEPSSFEENFARPEALENELQPGGTELRLEPNASGLYLDLLKKCLTRTIFPDAYRALSRPDRRRHTFAYAVYPPLTKILERIGLRLYRRTNFDLANRESGTDWPLEADTMIGLKRLDSLQHCIEQVLRDEVPGDFIETGVWRGGTCIFMRAALEAYGDKARQVWVADSFEGFPKPDGRYQQDEDQPWWVSNAVIGIPLDQVKSNFSRYGLLDDRVRFLKGWFKDTLPSAPIERLAILRLDGDLYSSTMDALVNLYPKVSRGGFVIIDDYSVKVCRNAVDEFRARMQIEAPLIKIDWTGVFWRKLA